MSDGHSATLWAVADKAGGRLLFCLEPVMNPDEIVTFYRITERGLAPIESWQNFQEGAVTALCAGRKGATLSAVEMLPGGQYIVEARTFTERIKFAQA